MTVPASIFTGFDKFMNVANQYPTLSAEEEREHIDLFFNKNDQNSYKTLVLSNLRFVGIISKKYSGYGMPIMDIAQEGVIGLIKAVQRFDPAFGVRLASFAVHHIKSEIHDYVIRNYSMIKIATTKHQRKLFFNMNKLKTTSESLSNEEIKAIASELNVDASCVVHMEKRVKKMETSLDNPLSDDDGQIKTLSDTVSYDNSDFVNAIEIEESEKFKQDALMNGIDMLDERSKIIIQKRWLSGDKSTLHDLADEFSISAERVRQIEKNAFKTLKREILPSYSIH